MIDLSYWDLYREGEELLWSDVSLTQLGLKYGTPLYVLNKTVVQKIYSRFRQAMSHKNISFEVLYSFKTNPVPDFLNTLVNLGAGAEVVSEFELWLARNLGVQGEKIVVNGSAKSDHLLKEAVEARASMINVESAPELVRLADISKRAGIKANVGIRVNPGLKASWRDFTISTGASSSHIGVLPGDQEWVTLLNILKTSSLLNFVGLHFHIGSGIRSAKPYKEALDSVMIALDDLMQQGMQPNILDIGGGFNIQTLKELNIWEGIRLFGLGKSPSAPTIAGQFTLLDDIMQYYSARLCSFADKHDIDVPKLFIEPGRALSASAQLLLLTVHHLVERRKNKIFAICDAGALSLSPMLISEYHTIFVTNKGDNHPQREYDIVGNLPTPLDFVALKKKLPILSSGDVLAIMDVGAYFTSLGNNFAGPRPAIVMIHDQKEQLIRRKENFTDLIMRDLNFTAPGDGAIVRKYGVHDDGA